jgi:ATP-binding cassette, subfamily B, bacterial
VPTSSPATGAVPIVRAPVIDGAHPTRTLLRLLAPHRWRLAGSILLFLVKDSPLWVLPILTAAIIDVVVRQGALGELALYAALAVGVLVLNYPGHVLFVRLFSGAVRQIAADLRNGLAGRLQNLSIGFHSRASASVIQSKVVRDVENIELMFQQAVPPALSTVFILIGAVTVTALQVPAFVIVYALTVPIAVTLVTLVRRRMNRRNEEFRRQVERFSARVGEMATLMPITRAHGLERIAESRVADGAEGVRSAGFTLDRLNGRFGAMAWVSMQVLAVTTLVLAAAASITGFLPVTAGQVVLLSTYFTMLTGGIINLLNLTPIFTRGLESVRSIAEVMQEPDLEFNHGKRRVEETAGHLELDDVSVTFDGGSELALDHVSLDIAAGETVAFVGPSGSGKSTLLNTVLGFIRPTSGRMLLDGLDMEALDLRTFRSFVSVVPQESVLFEGSIRDNVTYGLTGVSDEDVMSALRDANAIDIIETLPDGWDTVVGERGARLSGGQRQRLAIARALIRNPRVLLLDEATSALDTESETKVRDALARLMRDRTTLVVAHRLTTIRSADRIVVLDHGRIVETGDHDSLLAAGGRYAALHRAQSA